MQQGVECLQQLYLKLINKNCLGHLYFLREKITVKITYGVLDFEAAPTFLLMCFLIRSNLTPCRNKYSTMYKSYLEEFILLGHKGTRHYFQQNYIRFLVVVFFSLFMIEAYLCVSITSKMAVLQSFIIFYYCHFIIKVPSLL